MLIKDIFYQNYIQYKNNKYKKKKKKKKKKNCKEILVNNSFIQGWTSESF